jgi:hypothetical protein
MPKPEESKATQSTESTKEVNMNYGFGPTRASNLRLLSMLYPYNPNKKAEG